MSVDTYLPCCCKRWMFSWSFNFMFAVTMSIHISGFSQCCDYMWYFTLWTTVFFPFASMTREPVGCCSCCFECGKWGNTRCCQNGSDIRRQMCIWGNSGWSATWTTCFVHPWNWGHLQWMCQVRVMDADFFDSGDIYIDDVHASVLIGILMREVTLGQEIKSEIGHSTDLGLFLMS